MGAVQSIIEGWTSACFDRVRPNPKVHLVSSSDANGGRGRKGPGSASSDSEGPVGVTRRASGPIAVPVVSQGGATSNVSGSGSDTPSYSSRRATMKIS
jgi:hypothetical protein